jgi:UDP-glucuronate 4-epimerase
MKIIITGSAGFIGYHLANKLLKNKKNRILGIDSINNYYSKKIKNLRVKMLKEN